jgi:hypothetical protein
MRISGGMYACNLARNCAARSASEMCGNPATGLVVLGKSVELEQETEKVVV